MLCYKNNDKNINFDVKLNSKFNSLDIILFEKISNRYYYFSINYKDDNIDILNLKKIKINSIMILGDINVKGQSWMSIDLDENENVQIYSRTK